MSRFILSRQKLFGLLELDAAGTVLYSRIEEEAGSDGSPSDVTGRNFYSEVTSFLNAEEFHQRLDSFTRSSQQADSILFTCQYEDGPVPVKVLLARIRERSGDDVTKSILVHIKKAQ